MDRLRRACLSFSLHAAMNFLSPPRLFLSQRTLSREKRVRECTRVRSSSMRKQRAIMFFQRRSAYSAPVTFISRCEALACHTPLNIATRPQYASVTFLHHRKFPLRIMINATRSGEKEKSSKRNITDFPGDDFLFSNCRSTLISIDTCVIIHGCFSDVR